MTEKRQKLLDYYSIILSKSMQVDEIQSSLDHAGTLLNEETIHYLQERLDQLRFSTELELINIRARLSKP